MSTQVQQRIQDRIHSLLARPLRWPARPNVRHALDAVASYLRTDLHGEAALTVGSPLAEWRRHEIDAVVSVGPLECMPNKIAEAQLYHVAEREGLLSLTLSMNGDPVDDAVLDNFAFEVHARFRNQRPRSATVSMPNRFEPPWTRNSAAPEGSPAHPASSGGIRS